MLYYGHVKKFWKLLVSYIRIWKLSALELLMSSNDTVFDTKGSVVNDFSDKFTGWPSTGRVDREGESTGVKGQG